MPKAARLADIGAAHGCFPPTPIIAGSGDVSINGRPAARKGDPLIPHACGNCPPHPRSIAAGSATVSINGKPAARASDSIGCGGSVSGGSGDTLIGDVGMGGALKSCMKGASDSASPFVKVDFDAFPMPEQARKAVDFTMAAYAGPEALKAQVMGQAQALVGAQLQSIQAQAFSPALSAIGVNPANIAMDTLKAAATGASLQNALIGQVQNLAGGNLSAQLTKVVSPELANTLVGQLSSAIQGGGLNPSDIAGSLMANPSEIFDNPLPSAMADAAAAIQKGSSTPEAIAKQLTPAVSPLVQDAAEKATADFLGA